MLLQEPGSQRALAGVLTPMECWYYLFISVDWISNAILVETFISLQTHEKHEKLFQTVLISRWFFDDGLGVFQFFFRSHCPVIEVCVTLKMKNPQQVTNRTNFAECKLSSRIILSS